MTHKDPEKRREYERAYYEKNRETILAKRRNVDKEERERILQYKKDWYWQNREHHIAMGKKRKRTEYAGRCVVCGASTVGYSKNTPPPRYCKDHRKELWAEKLAEQRREEVIKATRHVPKSSKRYVPKMTQEKLAQASYKGPAFSHLERNEDRDQDEKNGNPPAPRKWASS